MVWHVLSYRHEISMPGSVTVMRWNNRNIYVLTAVAIRVMGWNHRFVLNLAGAILLFTRTTGSLAGAIPIVNSWAQNR